MLAKLSCLSMEIGVVDNSRKWLNVCLAYINNLSKTMQQNNEALTKANERLPFVQGKIMVLP